MTRNDPTSCGRWVHSSPPGRLVSLVVARGRVSVGVKVVLGEAAWSGRGDKGERRLWVAWTLALPAIEGMGQYLRRAELLCVVYQKCSAFLKRYPRRGTRPLADRSPVRPSFFQPARLEKRECLPPRAGVHAPPHDRGVGFNRPRAQAAAGWPHIRFAVGLQS